MNRQQRIIKLYNDMVDDYEMWFDIHDDIFQKELALLREHVVFKKIALEVGIGSGRFAKSLGISMGIDPSIEMIKRCEEKKIKAILGIAEYLPFNSNEFEQVFYITSLCFVDDINKSIAEARRVLATNGIITIAFIDSESILGSWSCPCQTGPLSKLMFSHFLV